MNVYLMLEGYQVNIFQRKQRRTTFSKVCIIVVMFFEYLLVFSPNHGYDTRQIYIKENDIIENQYA